MPVTDRTRAPTDRIPDSNYSIHIKKVDHDSFSLTRSDGQGLALDGVADGRRLEEHAQREVADDLAVVVDGL